MLLVVVGADSPARATTTQAKTHSSSAPTYQHQQTRPSAVEKEPSTIDYSADRNEQEEAGRKEVAKQDGSPSSSFWAGVQGAAAVVSAFIAAFTLWAAVVAGRFAKKAANAAARSLAHAKAATEKELRPYLAFEWLPWEERDPLSGNFVVPLRLTNHGQLPARIMSASFGTGDLTGIADLDIIELADANLDNWVLGKGEDITLYPQLIQAPPSPQVIRPPLRKIGIVAAVEYIVITGGQKRYSTKSGRSFQIIAHHEDKGLTFPPSPEDVRRWIDTSILRAAPFVNFDEIT